MWKTLETIAWITGLMCVAIWASAHIHHIVVSQASITRFKQVHSEFQTQQGEYSDRPKLNVQDGATAVPSPVSDAGFAVTPDYRGWSPDRIKQHQNATAFDQSIHASQAIGLIEIDSVGISAPLFAGVDERSLNAGVGLIPHMAAFQEGNAGIAGHRDGFFRSLRDIALDDVITITTVQQVFQYRVSATFVVEPEDVWVLEPTSTSTLTLVTCYPFYFVGSAPERFIVRAQLITTPLTNFETTAPANPVVSEASGKAKSIDWSAGYGVLYPINFAIKYAGLIARHRDGPPSVTVAVLPVKSGLNLVSKRLKKARIPTEFQGGQLNRSGRSVSLPS